MKKTIELKFEIGEIVEIDGVICKILDFELHDSILDYLCEPVDPTIMVLGQSVLGSGWVFQHNIEKVETK